MASAKPASAGTKRTADRGGGGAPAARAAEPDLAALRERVAAIVGTGLHRLEAAPRAEAPRQEASDIAGSLAAEGLTEIHADETRGGGSAAGLVLALAARLGASARRPLLWISQDFGLHEAGRLYGPGLAAFGFDPGHLVCVETARLEEAIWAAEEAARSGAPAAAVLEVRGNPARLSLDGTRRLHVRAREAGVTLFLLRQGAVPEPTAAPARLRVAGGPAAGVASLGAAGERLIGHPVFCVAVEKSRDGRARRLFLEWNPHDRRLHPIEPPALGSRRPPSGDEFRDVEAGTRDLRPLPVAALSPTLHRPDPAREARPGLALRRVS